MLPKVKPISLKERLSVLFVEKGRIDVLDGAFVVVDEEGVRTQIPVGGVACLMLEPGTRISHRAVELSARAGTLLTWVGEAGVRFYSSGQPGGSRSDRLLYQAGLALDESTRLKVVRRMFEIRFGDAGPSRRSVEQLRGMEGVRVRELYKALARQFGIKWKGRKYDPRDWDASDLPNQALSSATACLYGVVEAAVLAAGYAPAIGFLHTGKPLSFVYDIADLVKFETVVPVAFAETKKGEREVERRVRLGCRDAFRRTKLLKRLIPLIDEVLAAGGMKPPEAGADQVGPAFEDEKGIGDVGHRG